MPAIMCILLPVFFLNILRVLIVSKSNTRFKYLNFPKGILTVIFDIFLLNGTANFILIVFFNNWGQLFTKLNRYPSFAIKYFMLSCVIAMLIIIIEKYFNIQLTEQILNTKKYSQSSKAKFISGVIIFIWMALSVIFVYYDNYRMISEGAIQSTEPYGPIIEGQVITQDFTCNEDGLKDIKIYITTYARTNHCVLTATLYSNEKTIQDWEIECKQLDDNAYYTLMLDHIISDSKSNVYHLELTSNGTENDTISVYKNSSGDYSGLSVNGEEKNGESLCYQLQYQTGLKRNVLIYLIRFALICLIILFIWIVIQKLSLTVVRSFLILWLPLSCLYFCSNTLFNVPDEVGHFYRAYEISLGNMISDYDEEANKGGRELPLDVDISLLRKSWQSYEENKKMELTANWTFKDFSNLSLYAPVSYTPQSLGIFIARQISLNIPFIVYMGRVMNWLCITFVLCCTLRLLPYGKEFFALIALMPMNIHEAVSLSPDGMVVALSGFIVAFVLYLRERPSEILKGYQIAILYITALCISLYKIVYLPFCLFYILISAKKFKYGIKGKWFHAILMGTCVCAASLMWLHLCNKFLVQSGTNSELQLSFLLSHPFQYYVIVCRTAMNVASALIFQMVGDSLARLNVATVSIFTLAYIIYLAHKMHGSFILRKKDRTGIKIVSGIVVISIILLIFTSLYLQWTVIYNASISGIQGRYFIALLLPVYLLVTKDTCVEGNVEVLEFKSQWLILMINICACASLLFANLE